MKEFITIKGAREHNLKNITLEIPRNKMIVFTGLSGSGKSSLAFDTIFAEGQRRYVESLSAYARQFLGVMQKPDVDEIEGLSPAIAIDQKAHSANPRSTVATITEIYDYLRVLYARIGKPFCVQCERPITKLSIEEIIVRIIDDAQAQETKKDQHFITALLLAPVVFGRKGEYYQLLYDLYNSGFTRVRVDGAMHSLKERIKLSRYQTHTIEVVVDEIPVARSGALNKEDRQRIAEATETAIDYGNGVMSVVYDGTEERTLSTKHACAYDGFAFPEIEPRLFSFNSPYGYCTHCTGLGTEGLFSEEPCTVCHGARLNIAALHVRVSGKNIVELAAMSIENAMQWFMDLEDRAVAKKRALNEVTPQDLEISTLVRKEIFARLEFLMNVGLHYLTLDRRAGTLSGGEAQRIRLASQLGSRLVGAMYVLDEPTIGLHQRDNERLIRTLQELRDLGNTILVVEHDEDLILSSDYLVDIGPGAGVHGGDVVAAGPIPEILKTGKSLTIDYLTRKKVIPVPKTRRKPSHELLTVIGATENNLKNVKVEIPLRRFVCVTGVSGSGKSSLVNEVIYKTLAKKLHLAGDQPGTCKEVKGVDWLDKVLLIDQGAIGRTPRSNPATYTGAFNYIREIFAATPEARMRGYKVGRFSFNVKGGRCENCEGNGTIAIEMHFLPTVYVTCDVCKGKRFEHETLQVHYKDKNISDVLAMTIEEAEIFFKDIPWIYERLKILNEVGLDYLTLGQSATTLSGGEAQRIKLAKELARRDTGRTLYVLDEPSIGLHYEDVRKLLEVLERLVKKGNTILIIEHNLDIIKMADWVIDLGPEGGEGGGEIVATGTPEDVARKAGSFTGKYLKKVLNG